MSKLEYLYKQGEKLVALMKQEEQAYRERIGGLNKQLARINGWIEQLEKKEEEKVKKEEERKS